MGLCLDWMEGIDEDNEIYMAGYTSVAKRSKREPQKMV